MPTDLYTLLTALYVKIEMAIWSDLRGSAGHPHSPTLNLIRLPAADTELWSKRSNLAGWAGYCASHSRSGARDCA